MARNWEAVCQTWIKASSDTECEKQEHAVGMIRDAIKGYEPLAQRLAQGNLKIIPRPDSSLPSESLLRGAPERRCCLFSSDLRGLPESGIDYFLLESSK
jgi:hypothetical protein